MTSTVIYNDFRAPQFWQSRFRRAEYEIWDANLSHGDVRPFACPQLECDTLPNYQTLYPLPDCKCLGFTDVRDIVRGFCHDQHFMIDGGTLVQSTEAELCANTFACLAGAPFVPAAPSVGSGCSGCDGTGVSYVVTTVTSHAGILVESAPSPASAIVASRGEFPNASVNWGAPPAGYCVVATRLYRVETTFEDGTDSIPAIGAEFVFVQQFGPGAGGFVDNIPTHATGGPLTTFEPMAFPAPGNLVGVARTADGIVVADLHRVYISLPGQPQFTYDGVVEIEDEILAIRAINNTVFVFTDNKPVKLSYQHTDQVMSVDRQVIDRKLPPTSLRSISVYDNKIFFASTFGLYTWDTGAYGSDIRMVSGAPSQLWTKDQWKRMQPNTITGTAYEFGYIFTGDGMNHSLMVEFAGDGTDTAVGTQVMPISFINAAAFGLTYDGHIVYHQNGETYCWDYSQETCTEFVIHDNQIPNLCEKCDCCPWRISFYHDNEGKNRYSKLRIEWDERSATHLEASFFLKAFGEQDMLAGPLQVISSRAFSIPRFVSAQTFCVEVTGCGIMHEIRMGTSNQEIVSNSNNQLANRQLPPEQ